MFNILVSKAQQLLILHSATHRIVNKKAEIDTEVVAEES